MKHTDQSSLQLTQRDQQIILMVYHYDGLLSYQIRRRFWPSFGARSSSFDRLSRLVDAGYLRRKGLESPTGKGSGPSLITIGKASHPILVQLLGLTSADLKRLRHSFVPLLWRHEAEVRDLRLVLELVCDRSSQVSLDAWVNEADLRRSPIKVKLADATVDLVPDGAFTLSLGPRAKHYYLELDRDTEASPQRWMLRVKAYLTYVGNQPSPVLVVVPTRRRLERIQQWIEQAAADLSVSPGIFALAIADQVNEFTILQEPIWQVVGQTTPSSLVPRVGSALEPDDDRPRSWAEFLLGKEMTSA